MAKEIKEQIKVAIEFRECDTCRAKLGSPILCDGCLFNRNVIQRLSEELQRLITPKDNHE